MQVQVQLALTGYNEKNVEIALTNITKMISDSQYKLKVAITGEPVKREELLENQPPLHGCDHRNVTIFAIPVSGSLRDVKRLADTETPDGVMVEVLPQVV